MDNSTRGVNGAVNAAPEAPALSPLLSMGQKANTPAEEDILADYWDNEYEIEKIKRKLEKQMQAAEEALKKKYRLRHTLEVAWANHRELNGPKQLDLFARPDVDPKTGEIMEAVRP